MPKPARFYAEFRAEVDGNRLTGHAALFDRVAELPFGFERLAPTAFDKALADPETDVRALLNHDPKLVLGRQSAGTLDVAADDTGLRFSVNLPDVSYARDLRELVSRGDLTGASFGFIPGETQETRYRGRSMTTHTSVEALIDVSAVTFPAYEGASVSLRYLAVPSRATARDQAIRARARVLLGGV